MTCRECGNESFDFREKCEHCGAPTSDPADDLLGLRLEPESSASGHVIHCAPSFQIDDDIFIGSAHGAPVVPGADYFIDQGGCRPAAGAARPGPVIVLSREESDLAAGVGSIIDRDHEVPERYWGPEVAGLGERALALLVDQSVLMAVLGVFFLGASLALRLNGIDTGLLLDAAGIKASALPFALLAAGLSLAYHSFFHGSTGRTPGKALLGIEVRTAAGGPLSRGRAILRWLGATLGLVCAGVGIFWAVFEPRRRGWADLISGTVIARPRR